MMYQRRHLLLSHGGPDSPRPWSKEETVKFVCPVPGYDRHFTMLAEFGIEMVTVPMHDDGPDVAAVPRWSRRPVGQGHVAGADVRQPDRRRLLQRGRGRPDAPMPTAAPDFRILWDNAYAFHHLTDVETKSADALGLASASGHPNRPIMFASTSKITFAGAGVAAARRVADNKEWYLKQLALASIGPDKINQLRHVEFFGDADGVRDHMRKHRELIAPKFAAVQAALSARLDGLGIADWSQPTGGYFVDLNVLDGTAARVVQLAKEAGIALTPAGSAFPHGKDPATATSGSPRPSPCWARSRRRWPAWPCASSWPRWSSCAVAPSPCTVPTRGA